MFTWTYNIAKLLTIKLFDHGYIDFRSFRFRSFTAVIINLSTKSQPCEKIHFLRHSFHLCLLQNMTQCEHFSGCFMKSSEYVPHLCTCFLNPILWSPSRLYCFGYLYVLFCLLSLLGVSWCVVICFLNLSLHFWLLYTSA